MGPWNKTLAMLLAVGPVAPPSLPPGAMDGQASGLASLGATSASDKCSFGMLLAVGPVAKW